MYHRENRKGIYRILILLGVFLFFSACTKKERVLTDQELYDKAAAYMEKEKYTRANETFEKLEQEYPESPLMAKIRLNKAAINFEMKEYDQARAEYERFLNFHPTHEESDLARFRIAMTYNNEILTIDRDQTFTMKAIEAFERFLKEYPQSRYTEEAKGHVGYCRRRLAEHDLYVGRFYLKTGSYRAARGRLQKIWGLYPDVSWMDEVLFLIAKTYRGEGMEDEAMHVECLLSKRFPGSPFLEKVHTPCQGVDIIEAP